MTCKAGMIEDSSGSVYGALTHLSAHTLCFQTFWCQSNMEEKRHVRYVGVSTHRSPTEQLCQVIVPHEAGSLLHCSFRTCRAWALHFLPC